MKQLKDICKIERIEYLKDALIEWNGITSDKKTYIIYLKNTNKKYSNPNNSHLLYILGITDQKPKGYVTRSGGAGLCDIDLDCEERYRHKLIKYITNKYGEDFVAHIGTFGTMKAKSAIRRVAKTLGHQYIIGDELAKLTLEPVAGEVPKLKESIEKVSELNNYRNSQGTQAEILKWAQKVEGMVSACGVHASGIIISNNSLLDKVPMFKSKEGQMTTQWDMNIVEEIGLIKFDILGLDALTKIHNCIDIIKKKHDKDIDISNIPLDDKKTFANLQAGDTAGIFQLEASSGIRDMLVQVKPTKIEDIFALISIYRPGPLGSKYKDTYFAVRAGLQEPEYLVPELEPILKDTEGWLIYQEQCCVKDEPVWLCNGVKKIQDVLVGDEVATVNGTYKVSNAGFTGVKSCVKITTSYGELKLTNDHPVLLHTLNYKDAGKLEKNDLIPIGQIYFNKTYEATTTEIDDAYFLGVLVGDGCLSKNTTTIACESQAQALWYKVKFDKYCDYTNIYLNGTTWYICLSCKLEQAVKGKPRTRLNKLLLKYGILGKTKDNKTVPKFILTNKNLMKAFILGWLDSDGSINHNGQPVHITSIVKANLDTLTWMCRVLDIPSSQRKNRVYLKSLSNLKAIARNIRTYKEIDFDYWSYGTQYKQSLVFCSKDLKNWILNNFKSIRSFSKATGFDRTRLLNSFVTEQCFPLEYRVQLRNTLKKYARVLNIEPIGKHKVYDLTVKTVHQFNVGGHVVHNCMRIAKDLCGYTGGQADELRKAIGKKKKDLMDKHEKSFKEGWEKNNLPIDKVGILWDSILNFAEYGFNLSHAAAYGMITYQTAWLKTHYPSEFMCAVLMSEAGKQDSIIKCLAECKRIGIDILPPNINNSHESFWVNEDNKIRFGLGPIKNIGKGSEVILQERKINGTFTSLRNFCERIDLGIVNRKKLESLIQAGALDCFNTTRASLINSVENIWEYRKQLKSYEGKLKTFEKKVIEYEDRFKDIDNGKLSTTGKKLLPKKKPVEPTAPVWPEPKELDELLQEEIQIAEHELLGFYVTSHPLDTLSKSGITDNFSTIEDIKSLPADTIILLAAVVTKKNEITTKAKKKKMAFLHIEDLTGHIEAVCFPSVYDRSKHHLEEIKPLKIKGKVEVTETDSGKVTKIIINNILPLNLLKEEKSIGITATINLFRVNNIIELINRYSGNKHEVSIILESNDGTYFYMPKQKIGNYRGKFIRELAKINNE